jgi:mannitol/fructose-specific phosphotransferase system IIA component (Ntr-type)
MDSLLDALQEGRLFELPESDKTGALQFLAHVIEAFPEVPAGTDVAGDVMKREASANTGFGRGWACPHARVPFDEDLKCAIGWSPRGVDYGAPDDKPVNFIVMYLVPSNQRNHYLREISTIARAVQSFPNLDRIGEAKDLDDVRNYLLDLIDTTRETSGADVRARMIRLQTKAPVAEPPLHDLSNLVVEPITVITGPAIKPVALTQNNALLEWLDSQPGLASGLEAQGLYEAGAWRVVRRGATAFMGGKTMHDCVAVRVIGKGTVGTTNPRAPSAP